MAVHSFKGLSECSMALNSCCASGACPAGYAYVDGGSVVLNNLDCELDSRTAGLHCVDIQGMMRVHAGTLQPWRMHRTGSCCVPLWLRGRASSALRICGASVMPLDKFELRLWLTESVAVTRWVNECA
jgi:hypothetical protein